MDDLFGDGQVTEKMIGVSCLDGLIVGGGVDMVLSGRPDFGWRGGYIVAEKNDWVAVQVQIA